MVQCSNAVLKLYRLHHKSPTKPNREPVDKLSDGDEADSKAKSTDPSKAGDEVQPGHLGSSLVLWVNAQEQFFFSNNLRQQTYVLNK